MRTLRRGFTLIELLVVVAIIALLIAILLPSLGRAKANAVRVKCAAQLKQWGTVVTMYAQEQNDWFGAYFKDDSAVKHYWSGIAVSNAQIYDAEWGAIDQSTGMSKYAVGLRTCPGDPVFGQVAAAGAGAKAIMTAGSRPPVDYAFARFNPTVSGSLMWRFSQFNHPSTTSLMVDSPTIQYMPAGNATMYNYYAFNSLADLDSEPGETLTQALQKRHLGRGNVLFLDDHVEQAVYQDYAANIISGTSQPTDGSKNWLTIAQ